MTYDEHYLSIERLNERNDFEFWGLITRPLVLKDKFDGWRSHVVYPVPTDWED